MNALIENISDFVSLSGDTKKDINEHFTLQHFSKKERIITQGTVNTKMYFLITGIVRSYQHRNEKEMTTWIYYPHMYFASWDSFLYQRNSDETFEVIVDSTMVSIEYQVLQQLFKKHPVLETWGRKLMEQYTTSFNRFSQKIRFATAQEKYDYYLDHFPQQPKIKLGHIASFLGIAQETLSRLRSKKE